MLLILLCLLSQSPHVNHIFLLFYPLFLISTYIRDRIIIFIIFSIHFAFCGPKNLFCFPMFVMLFILNANIISFVDAVVCTLVLKSIRIKSDQNDRREKMNLYPLHLCQFHSHWMKLRWSKNSSILLFFLLWWKILAPLNI